MPSVSKKQHNLMAMVANDPAAAKRMGIPQSVGEDFMKADKGRKFGSGSRPDRQGINKPKTDHGKSALFAKGGEMAESKKMMGKEVAFMKKKGAPKSMLKHEMAEMKGKKMAMGGFSSLPTRDTSGISSMPARTGEYTGGFTSGKPGGFSTGVTNKLPPGSRPGVGSRPGNMGGRPGGMRGGGEVKKFQAGGAAFQNRDAEGNPIGLPTGGGEPIRPNRLNRPGMGNRPGNMGGRPGGLGLGSGGPNIGPGGMRKGGLAAGHKQADGIAKKGKTRGMEVKMAGGGLAAGHKQADGVAKKGKTKAATVKMSGSKPLGMKKGGCY